MQREVKWGRFGGVYRLDDVKGSWDRVAEDCEGGATLAVCGEKLVAVGSEKGGIDGRTKMRVWENGKWEDMPKMLIGCRFPCVVSISSDCLVVMGGEGKDNWSRLNEVQIFDGRKKTWRFGPSLPQPCVAMSAVVYEGKIIVMGGGGMGRSVLCVDISDMVSYQCALKNILWILVETIQYAHAWQYNFSLFCLLNVSHIYIYNICTFWFVFIMNNHHCSFEHYGHIHLPKLQ